MRPSTILLALIFIPASLTVPSAGETPSMWNQFRGPEGSGVARDCQPPLKIGPSQIAWKRPLAPGQSSPVIHGKLIFLTALEEEQQLVTLAFDKASGALAWRQPIPEAPLEKVHKANSPAASTPYVDGQCVYVYFGSYGLLCYDHGGEQLWKKPIATPKSLYGMATSPIGYEGAVILVLDDDANLPGSQFSQSKIIAVDKASGETVWETARPFNRSGWSTPAILEHEGGDELVVLGNGRVYGYDASNGREKWFVDGFSRETISTPVTGNGHVFVSASMIGGVGDVQPDREPFWDSLLPFDSNGDGKLERSEMTGHFTFPLRPDLPLGHPGFGIPLPEDEAKREERRDGFMAWVDRNKDGYWTRKELIDHLSFDRGKPNLMAIRPGGSGDVEQTHVTWALHRNIPEIPSPIFYEDRLYLLRDGGILSAIDAGTGEMQYRKRLGASGHYSHSPVIANDHLYLASSRGVISVVRAGDAYALVHQCDLGEAIAATPAIDETTLYVRTERALTAFRRQDPASGSAGKPKRLVLGQEGRLVLLGNGLGSRMMRFGHFETEVQRRHPGRGISIRNMCDEGNTPGFRPHSGRNSPWAFPGAEKYRELLEGRDRWGSGHTGQGHFQKPDEWLRRLGAEAIVAFFGYNESFEGADGLEDFKSELADFVTHTLSQKYHGESAPQLALVSPIADEDLSASHGTPEGRVANANLALYTAAMEDVAARHGVLFVNLFPTTQRWYNEAREPLTRDGALLTETGYARLAPLLADQLFGPGKGNAGDPAEVLAAVREKNWLWHHYYKIPNGVHVFGRRNKPFGPHNYPHELKKLAEMTAARDEAIWAAVEGKSFDLAAADARTSPLPQIRTNYTPSGKTGTAHYKYGELALATLKVAQGYKVELFASEQEFASLANPVQMAFDNRGRLWISTMPTYPHYRPGDPKPNDKLIILEDTDGDGMADKETIFAGDLHGPTGFELAAEGVYVAQGTHLLLLKDTDGDDQADVRETVMSGFDDHDTHHVISAFCADPSGAIYMSEGTFLHSNIETAYGPVRSSNGGFFRYSPQRHHLERSARLPIPNPWGTAFDEWGQPFFTDTSDPNLRWMSPGTLKVRYGVFAPNPPNLIEEKHRVRPTSGLEFVSSRHFPEEVQGDVLINNTIGFLGTKQHAMEDDGSGYQSRHRQDLLSSSDGNFRPVDLEFAPDGSLYLLDWHNVLVGHGQHSARDPLRDHVHGRVYRITYPSRSLVKPAEVHGAAVESLLENLKVPEHRTRYRTRRELRGRPASQVLTALEHWTAGLDETAAKYEHHLLEALWVSWGCNRVDEALLRRLLAAGDPRVRAAAVRALRYSGHQVKDLPGLMMKAARDDHGRVRLEAIAAASWLDPAAGWPIVKAAGEKPMDDWIQPVYETALAHLTEQPIELPPMVVPETNLTGEARELFGRGAEVYRREGHCTTCHQANGEGLPAAQFPPLAGTKWVLGSEERLIKLTLNGLLGPMEVLGVHYGGQVPMTAFRALSDEEIAAVLTYVRNAFGNEASVITPAKVGAVRESTEGETGFYHPGDLLQAHPHE